MSLCGAYCDATIEMAQLPTLLKYARVPVCTLCVRSFTRSWLVPFLFLNIVSVLVQGASVVWDWFTPTSRAQCHPSPSRTCPSTSTWLSSGRASLCSSSASSSAVTSSGERDYGITFFCKRLHTVLNNIVWVYVSKSIEVF